VLAVDAIPSRLDMARAQGAETINYEEEDPLEAFRELTGGIGPDRVIDAVGIDANRPHRGPASREASRRAKEWDKLKEQIAPKAAPKGSNWHPGDAPGQALEWGVKCLAKAGTLSIIGVYPETMNTFPIGAAMNKNLTLQMGNCNHRKYIPELIEMIRIGAIDPTKILTRAEPLDSVIDAYKAFDERQPGWVKVELKPKRMHA
jgi:threonine dehydrogenase-like Zn-dependent dehydrogenase